MRDSKGRFKSRGLLVTLPSVNLLINYLVFLFIILPWIYVGLKFNIVEKVKELLNIIFLMIQNVIVMVLMVIINID